ncbi:MAG: WGR domain-containing protein [Pelatocladus maniniholoensis HA4357-MV3]|jgi:predicted DNA-binding WGR domain protein|uniref:WGR domain-containing protein n=1 Tax=Pelatocladus maniniholoensis HA4357-MV3 TaxID=1117104 RepID=A0A9E3H643_9NOST|nr:WGR domain-containing protein [Pelatocladus maniniholoensis HA4357-MV3]
MEIYLVFVDAVRNSNKFWSAKVSGSNLTVEWGRVGYCSQKKVHHLSSYGQAVSKYHSLVAQKKMKGYQASHPQIDSTRSVSEITRAINLLNILRPYVANRNFDDKYLQTLNEYLKIIPTPLGMQIDPSRVYQSAADVDHQRELLNSLLPSQALPNNKMSRPRVPPRGGTLINPWTKPKYI